MRRSSSRSSSRRRGPTGGGRSGRTPGESDTRGRTIGGCIASELTVCSFIGRSIARVGRLAKVSFPVRGLTRLAASVRVRLNQTDVGVGKGT